ncbi:MAG: GntR family transcriptional regulator [Thalassobaculum sp.]|uniref:GntR family transcriptional regulator n=1 Tax=Thalassobaculum sp. TaxID=2022740 RepID=UPI0032EB8DFE
MPSAPTRPDPPFADHPLPLYQRLARTLRDDIAAGTHPVGTTLPTEIELCESHGVSRHTVREALRLLVDQGLIERRQGAGSRVIAAAPPVAYVHTIRSLTELFSYTQDTRFEVASVELAPLGEADAAAIRWPAETRWLRISGVRWTADRREMVCHVTVFAHARFAGLLSDVGRQDGPIHALIEARSGERVEEAVQEVSAAPMPPAAAKALGTRVGAPALRIVRRYLDASGGPMMVAVNWHPGDRFAYTIHLRRDDESA